MAQSKGKKFPGVPQDSPLLQSASGRWGNDTLKAQRPQHASHACGATRSAAKLPVGIDARQTVVQKGARLSWVVGAGPVDVTVVDTSASHSQAGRLGGSSCWRCLEFGPMPDLKRIRGRAIRPCCKTKLAQPTVFDKDFGRGLAQQKTRFLKQFRADPPKGGCNGR